MANQSFGMVIGKGGADTIIRALDGMLDERPAATIFTDAEVAEITTLGRQGNRREACRRRDAPGGQGGDRRRRAQERCSASCCRTARATPASTSAMRNFRHAPGTMMIHLALDGLAGLAAGAELKRFAYVHLAPSLDQMARIYQQAIAGLLPDEPVLVVGQPTAIDPSRAPDGKHVLWVQVRVLPAEVRGDAAGEIAPAHWDAIKERYADRVLAIDRSAMRRACRHRFSAAPSSRQSISSARTPNLVGGDQICGSHHLEQNFLFRPARGFARWNTPVTESLAHRRGHLAGRRRRRRFGLHGRQDAGRKLRGAPIDRAQALGFDHFNIKLLRS